MPDTIYHVRSCITGARVVMELTDRELAFSECERLNTEARTGIRAAYGDGDDHVPAQRLVASNTGMHEPGLPAAHIGRILHDGQPMEYQVEIEARRTPDELAEIAARHRAQSEPSA